jgi:hypothetical protein
MSAIVTVRNYNAGETERGILINGSSIIRPLDVSRYYDRARIAFRGCWVSTGYSGSAETLPTTEIVGHGLSAGDDLPGPQRPVLGALGVMNLNNLNSLSATTATQNAIQSGVYPSTAFNFSQSGSTPTRGLNDNISWPDYPTTNPGELRVGFHAIDLDFRDRNKTNISCFSPISRVDANQANYISSDDFWNLVEGSDYRGLTWPRYNYTTEISLNLSEASIGQRFNYYWMSWEHVAYSLLITDIACLGFE